LKGGIAVIVLRNVSRIFQGQGVETCALNHVNLNINAGEFVAVMGPSGCGKSTLLNVVGMIDTPTSGQYFFDGLDVSGKTEEELVELRRKTVGFIFQSFNLIDDLTVYENVELPLVYNDLPKKERKIHVREALELVDLIDRAGHTPRQLSGGQQQRVAIARAIVCDPKLILADEPTGNLDTRNGEEIMEMLEALNEQGATILMVTHSAAHGAKAHRIVDMLDGMVIAPAPDEQHADVGERLALAI
jgi:putative ABC transport system ATP-binding protein